MQTHGAFDRRLVLFDVLLTPTAEIVINEREKPFIAMN